MSAVQQGLFGATRPEPTYSWSDGLVVKAIPKQDAERVISAGHYSGSCVWSSSVHLGIFMRDELIGALQLGPAMNPRSGAKIVQDAAPESWLELNRLWISDAKPANCASRAIAGAIKFVRRTRPYVEWIQSFADSRCGKLGAVYQAANFVYCGFHSSTFYRLDGEWFHKSLLGRAEYDKRGWWSGPKAARLRDGRERATSHIFRQYRYLYFVKQKARQRLLLPILPYPKPEDTLA